MRNKRIITLYASETFSDGAALVMGQTTKADAGIYLPASQRSSPDMPKISRMVATAFLGFLMNFYQNFHHLHMCETERRTSMANSPINKLQMRRPKEWMLTSISTSSGSSMGCRGSIGWRIECRWSSWLRTFPRSRIHLKPEASTTSTGTIAFRASEQGTRI